ncbi:MULTISPECIES: sialidase family protein [Cryobacterium]|uniref:sialidase family protein n=1 Tax=Cryobacterium TaxID=69578 RepID=UPI000CD41EA6|nr:MULTISPECIES: sialidase family protein [Cryobacterium]POH69928.1 neuraminidase (sialidase) [Cryobacterium zongtaii]TFC42942.1 neuraminidase (sialidase) [Cryobacterium sp. TMN-39-2]
MGATADPTTEIPLHITAGMTRDWAARPGTTGGVQCHASTVLAVGSSLLCAWFAGSAEGSPDNGIFVAVREPGGSWGDPRPVVGTGDTADAVAHWNPVLAHAADGSVWLFFKRGPRISEWSTWLCTSADDGASWTEPREVVPGDTGGRGPVKNPPVRAADGAWLAPASIESWAPNGAIWASFVDRSTDDGRTWNRVDIPVDRAQLSGAGVIQPALWVTGDTVGALLRSSEGHAYLAFSPDNGRTFTTAVPSTLPNNNSGLTVTQLPDGTLACVHNPTGTSWGARCPLAVSVSRDGLHWQTVAIVDDGRMPLGGFTPSLPEASGTGFDPHDSGVRTDGTGEYSYPAAVVCDDDLFITYTWQRRGIVCATVPLALLTHPEPNRKVHP